MSMKRFSILDKPFDAQSENDIQTAIFATQQLSEKTDFQNAEQCKYLSLSLRVLARTLANRCEDLSGKAYNAIDAVHPEAEALAKLYQSEKELNPPPAETETQAEEPKTEEVAS